MQLTEGICELALEALDLERLARFYCDALGCEIAFRDPDRVWLSCGPRARLGLWLPGKKEFGDQGGRHVHFALSVVSGRLKHLQARLDRLGIPYRGPVEHAGGDRSLYLNDPEGNVVEVWDYFSNRI